MSRGAVESRCTVESLGPADARYVYGQSCTWHGPVREAGRRRVSVDPSSHGEPQRHEDAIVPACPHCSGRLLEAPSEEMFYAVHAPQHHAMLRWSKGRCFADTDMLENAWRQAQEGE